MKSLSILILSLCLLPVAWAVDVSGLVVKQSPYSVAKTLDRLENVLQKKGIGIVTRWNHSAKAEEVGIPLRDTELLLFGNPKLGSHMFTAEQTAGIDLPMKALAWKDADGQVWLGYNDPQYIARRHGIDNRSEVIQKMQGALDKLTNAAVAD
ncbi:DUF302 domain-containing protein [Thiohalophilus sp.]|uniref:DUF302 domain-containing protein n=1 Tax=Thiohalophilus sp. TaxID=3028392 RepID=UPI003976D845